MDPLGREGALIGKALDLATRRHSVIAANIANVDTPGYRARTVRFDEILGEEIEEDRQGVDPRENGNTVVMEVELAELRKNELFFRMFTQAMMHKTRQMRSAISGRSG